MIWRNSARFSISKRPEKTGEGRAMILVETLNSWGAAWFGLMARGLIDTSILLALMLVVWLPMRRRVSAHLAHGLFCLVLLKLIVPVPVLWSWWQPIESARLVVAQLSPWAGPSPPLEAAKAK